MKNCKEIYLIGPGQSKLNYDISNLENKIIFNFSGDLVWFSENMIYPTYWTFLDPNSTTYLIDRIKTQKYNPIWFEGLKKHTKIMFHDFQGTDSFYNEGFTTSRGKDWNREVFGKTLLPSISSIFKETIKLPQKISINSYKPFYSNSPTPIFPIIVPENRIYMDKFICFILPTVLTYFEELKHIKCIGFGDFNKPRLYNNNSGGYEAYKISYNLFKNKLMDLLEFKKINIKFENRDSYFIELEKNNKNE